MQIIATIQDPSRLALKIDLKSKFVESIDVRPEFIDMTVVGRPRCRPFGITWASCGVFIANNRQLLLYDQDFNYKAIFSSALQVNTHQLAFRDGRIWAVSPWTNSIIGTPLDQSIPAIELNLADNKVVPYLARGSCAEDDRIHANSLLWTESHLYIAAHNFSNPSRILVFDAKSLSLLETIADAGKAIHGLAKENEHLFWISTGTSEIKSDKGHSIALSRAGYARGFGVTGDYFVVGISQFLARNERSAGDSWIQVIHRKTGKLEGEIHLTDTGSINDLRILDEYDHAHQNCPLSTRVVY